MSSNKLTLIIYDVSRKSSKLALFNDGFDFNSFANYLAFWYQFPQVCEGADQSSITKFKQTIVSNQQPLVRSKANISVGENNNL